MLLHLKVFFNTDGNVDGNVDIVFQHDNQSEKRRKHFKNRPAPLIIF